MVTAEGPKSFEGRLAAFRELERACQIEAGALCGLSEDETLKLLTKGVPQSLLFMTDIVPVIHRLYDYEAEGTVKTVLDVGPQTCAGSQFLAQLHAPQSFCRLKLRVSAIDITDTYAGLRRVLAPDIDFFVGDVFKIADRTWDFLVASHVIEHVPQPEEFLGQLQALANDFVIVAAPWMEDPLNTPGHINRIDKQFARRVGARDLQIYTSYTWGKDREVCIFWLPGTKMS